MSILIFFVLLQEKADFILIENPKALVIYDQYKNRLTQEEKEIFPLNAYFKIKKRFLVFEDALTKAMYVQYLNYYYYFGKESEKVLFHSEEAGKIQLYKNVSLQNKNYILHREHFKQKNLSLNLNDPVKKIFSTKGMNFFYAKKQDRFFSIKKKLSEKYFGIKKKRPDKALKNFDELIHDLNKLNNKIRQTEKAISPEKSFDKTTAFSYKRKGKLLRIYPKKEYKNLLFILRKKISSTSYVYTHLDSLLEVRIK